MARPCVAIDYSAMRERERERTHLCVIGICFFLHLHVTYRQENL